MTAATPILGKVWLPKESTWVPVIVVKVDGDRVTVKPEGDRDQIECELLALQRDYEPRPPQPWEPGYVAPAGADVSKAAGTIVVWANGPQVSVKRQAAARAALESGKLPDAPGLEIPQAPRLRTGSHHPRKLPSLALTGGESIVGKDRGGCRVLSCDGVCASVSVPDDTAWIPLAADALPWEDAYAPVHRSTSKHALGVVWAFTGGRTSWTSADRMSGIESRRWIESPGEFAAVKVRVNTRIAWNWRGATAWAVCGPVSESSGEYRYLLLKFDHGVVLVCGMTK